MTTERSDDAMVYVKNKRGETVTQVRCATWERARAYKDALRDAHGIPYGKMRIRWVRAR